MRRNDSLQSMLYHVQDQQRINSFTTNLAGVVTSTSFLKSCVSLHGSPSMLCPWPWRKAVIFSSVRLLASDRNCFTLRIQINQTNHRKKTQTLTKSGGATAPSALSSAVYICSHVAMFLADSASCRAASCRNFWFSSFAALSSATIAGTAQQNRPM